MTASSIYAPAQVVIDNGDGTTSYTFAADVEYDDGTKRSGAISVVVGNGPDSDASALRAAQDLLMRNPYLLEETDDNPDLVPEEDDNPDLVPDEGDDPDSVPDEGDDPGSVPDDDNPDLVPDSGDDDRGGSGEGRIKGDDGPDVMLEADPGE